MLRPRAFKPFTSGGRRMVVAILLTFALFSAVSVGLSIRATSGSQPQGRSRPGGGAAADARRALSRRHAARAYGAARPIPASRQASSPAAPTRCSTAARRRRSTGDDDETTLTATHDHVVRAQLEQERRLVRDLTRVGAAYLAERLGRGGAADGRRAARDPRPDRPPARAGRADLERLARRSADDRERRPTATSPT